MLIIKIIITIFNINTNVAKQNLRQLSTEALFSTHLMSDVDNRFCSVNVF